MYERSNCLSSFRLLARHRAHGCKVHPPDDSVELGRDYLASPEGQITSKDA